MSRPDLSNGGSQILEGKGADWWGTYTIWGSHSRHVRPMTRDSIMLSMYESRLLSWPTYF